MKHLAMLSLLLALGCGSKKKAEETPEPVGSAKAGSGSAKVGSGSGSGSGSAVAVKPWVHPKVFAGIDLEKMFAECWGFWNASKLDDFKGCLAADAVTDTPGLGQPEVKGADAIIADIKSNKAIVPDSHGEIELAMVNGTTVISIMLLTSASKKFGIEIAQVLDLDASGKTTHESDYYDDATLTGQVGGSPIPVRAPITKPMLQEIAVGTGDPREATNTDVIGKLTAALNKHDRKAAGELLDDALVWTEVPAATDADKKATLDGLEGMWKAFGNLKFTPGKTLAAGDFVAVRETFDGTNSGPLTMMGNAKATNKKVSLPFLAIYKLDGGKVVHAWIFYQSAGLVKQLGLK